VTPERIKSNRAAAELTPEEVAQLDKVAGEGGKQHRFIKTPWGRKVLLYPIP